jgi:uncharacterized membrane protein YbhN (UPF0104 family)
MVVLGISIARILPQVLFFIFISIFIFSLFFFLVLSVSSCVFQNYSHYVYWGGFFYISIYLYIYIYLGVFRVVTDFFSSSFINTTFKNITSLHSDTYGGVIYTNTPNYSSFTIDRSVFIQCRATSGGALYLNSSCPYILITRTRFEANSVVNNGSDIYVDTYPCFNDEFEGSLASSVCSNTPLGNRVYCNNFGTGIVNQLQNDCSEEVV